MSTERRVVLIANADSRRADLFNAALARRGWPPALLIPWIELIAGCDRLDDTIGAGAIVRIESPGRDFEVERHLIARGADEPETEDIAADAIVGAEALQLPFEKGRILYPRQWYRGFRTVLQSLAVKFGGRPGVRILNDPRDVIDLFDKRRGQKRIADAGAAMPVGLGSPGSFEELLSMMRATGHRRVFVKLACGSSASGVVAFAIGGERLRATTTVELVRSGGLWQLFNSRRIRAYDSPAEIIPLFDTLCREGVRVEEWLPKAGLRGKSCDMRVLIVAGRERQIVVRLSETPLTNLHLLNERCEAEELQAEVLPEQWEAAMADCRRAAAAFPGCLHLGIDLVFTRGFRRHAIVEANAFGDLLPGSLWNGLDTYETQLAALEGARS